MNLLERGSRLLTDHIDELRAAVAKVRLSRPFHIDGWVVLPHPIRQVARMLRRGWVKGCDVIIRRKALRFSALRH